MIGRITNNHLSHDYHRNLVVRRSVECSDDLLLAFKRTLAESTRKLETIVTPAEGAYIVIASKMADGKKRLACVRGGTNWQPCPLIKHGLWATVKRICCELSGEIAHVNKVFTPEVRTTLHEEIQKHVCPSYVVFKANLSAGLIGNFRQGPQMTIGEPPRDLEYTEEQWQVVRDRMKLLRAGIIALRKSKNQPKTFTQAMIDAAKKPEQKDDEEDEEDDEEDEEDADDDGDDNPPLPKKKRTEPVQPEPPKAPKLKAQAGKPAAAAASAAPAKMPAKKPTWQAAMTDKGDARKDWPKEK